MRDGPGPRGRQVPWSREAELSVLGAILMDGEIVAKVLDDLPADAIYQEKNRRIYREVARIHGRGDPVDVVTLAEELKSRDELEAVGGMAYLAQLVDAVPTAANWKTHARIVRQKATQRHLIEAAAEIGNRAFEATPGEVEKLLDDAEQRLLSVSRSAASTVGYRTSDNLVMAYFDQVERARENPGQVGGLETGFSTLDVETDGASPGELWIVAGRPSMGKTALTLDVARDVAVRQGRSVAIYSLEMRAEEVIGRMVCSQGRVPYLRARRGQLRQEGAKQLADAAGAVKQAPIMVADTTGLTIHRLRSNARRILDREGLDLLIVDYLQLMRGPEDAGNREQEIASISRALKELALELEIPVIAISQLSRAPEQRAGHARPRLSDLRESGAIEQDADVVLFVYREEMYLEPTDARYSEVKNRAELIIGKQRNGPTGTVELFFRKPEISFDEVSPHQEEGAA